MAEPVRIMGFGESDAVQAQVSRDHILFVRTSENAIRVDVDSGNSAITYVGRAAIGSLPAASVWQVMKVDEISGTIITWADSSSSFDNIYDNRESLTYG